MGQASVESDEHTRHLLSSRNEETAKVNNLVGADLTLMIREVAKELEISSGLCQAVLIEYLSTRHVSKVCPVATASRPPLIFSLSFARKCKRQNFFTEIAAGDKT
jgi:hypothetical protein